MVRDQSKRSSLLPDFFKLSITSQQTQNGMVSTSSPPTVAVIRSPIFACLLLLLILSSQWCCCDAVGCNDNCANGGKMLMPSNVFGVCRCKCPDAFAGPKCQFVSKRRDPSSLFSLLASKAHQQDAYEYDNPTVNADKFVHIPSGQQHVEPSLENEFVDQLK